MKRADVLLFLLHQVRDLTGTMKVTDLLYSCYDAAANGGDFEKVLEEIKSRYYEIIKGLGLALSMEEDFQLIKENFKAQIGRGLRRFPWRISERQSDGCLSWL